MNWDDIRNEVMGEVEAISIIADEEKRECQITFSDGEVFTVGFDEVFDFCQMKHPLRGIPKVGLCWHCTKELAYIAWFSVLMAKEGFKQITWGDE